MNGSSIKYFTSIMVANTNPRLPFKFKKVSLSNKMKIFFGVTEVPCFLVHDAWFMELDPRFIDAV